MIPKIPCQAVICEKPAVCSLRAGDVEIYMCNNHYRQYKGILHPVEKPKHPPCAWDWEGPCTVACCKLAHAGYIYNVCKRHYTKYMREKERLPDGERSDITCCFCLGKPGPLRMCGGHGYTFSAMTTIHHFECEGKLAPMTLNASVALQQEISKLFIKDEWFIRQPLTLHGVPFPVFPSPYVSHTNYDWRMMDFKTGKVPEAAIGKSPPACEPTGEYEPYQEGEIPQGPKPLDLTGRTLRTEYAQDENTDQPRSGGAPPE